MFQSCESLRERSDRLESRRRGVEEVKSKFAWKRVGSRSRKTTMRTICDLQCVLQKKSGRIGNSKFP